MSGIKKTMDFNETLQIEVYNDGIALREFIDYDDNSFLTFNWEELDKLIEMLQKISKEHKK